MRPIDAFKDVPDFAYNLGWEMDNETKIISIDFNMDKQPEVINGVEVHTLYFKADPELLGD